MSLEAAMNGSSSIERLRQLQALKRNSLLGSFGCDSNPPQGMNGANALEGTGDGNELSSLARLQQLQQSMGGIGFNTNLQGASGMGNRNMDSFDRFQQLGAMGVDLSQLRSQFAQQQSNSDGKSSGGGDMDTMALLQQQLRNAGGSNTDSLFSKQLAQQHGRIGMSVMNDPNSLQANAGGPATANSNLMGGGAQMNPVNQMMLLQQFGMDPTPRRESGAASSSKTGGNLLLGSGGGGMNLSHQVQQDAEQQQQQQPQQGPDMNLLLQQYLARSSSNANSSEQQQTD